MRQTFKLIEEKEYRELFRLIDNNRSRLKKYFPNTIDEIISQQTAKHHLKNSLEKTSRKEKYLFGIYDKDRLIGYINVKNIDWEVPKCELGYFIDQSFEGQSITTKVIAAITNYCFETLKMNKVFLRIGPENIGSIRIAEKNGFQKEGILRNEFRLWTGELIDVLYFGKLKED